MDLFETLKEKVGCPYISDLKFAYKDIALETLGRIDADTNQKVEVQNYIMGGETI